MKRWAVIKVVDSRIIGCMVGPFATQADADGYAERVTVGALGYEKWVVRELEAPLLHRPTNVCLVSGYVPLNLRHRSDTEYRQLGQNLEDLSIPKSIYFGRLEDCWMHKTLDGKGFVPRDAHDPGKNTFGYHCVQHEKTAWMVRAAKDHPDATVFVWMDYGIFHMDGFTPERVMAFLKECEKETEIAIPGAWPKGQDGGPCWRFNGSILVCHRDYLKDLDAAIRGAALIHTVQTKTIIWEVNIWDMVESCEILPIRWYGATHDATMLTAYKANTELSSD